MLTRIATSLLALAAGSIAHDATAAGFRQASGLTPTPDAVLRDMRGGFITAGGLTLDIGITTSTYINGQLALRTSVSTGPTGPTAPTTPTAPTAPTAPTTPGGQSSGGGAAAPVSNASATNTPAPPTPTSTPTPKITPPVVVVAGASPPAGAGPTPPSAPSGALAGSGSQGSSPIVQGALAPSSTLAGGSGGSGGSGTTVTTTTNDGQTTVVQNPSQGINALANSANDQNIRLDTQVNLVLPGFDAVQRQGLLSSMGMKMGADGAFGIVSSLPH